jgi:hypothetical protein
MSDTTFKDRLGRMWTVELHAGMLPAIKAAGLDLGAFLGEESREQADKLATALMRTLLNPETLGQILWVACEEQADAAGVDPQAFASGMNADALLAATDAVIYAAFDIVFRRQAFRQLIRRELPKRWAEADAKAGQ